MNTLPDDVPQDCLAQFTDQVCNLTWRIGNPPRSDVFIVTSQCDNEIYVVTARYKVTKEQWYTLIHDELFEVGGWKVIAWMPRPEAYTPPTPIPTRRFPDNKL